MYTLLCKLRKRQPGISLFPASYDSVGEGRALKKILLRLRAASDGEGLGAAGLLVSAAFIIGALAGGIVAAYGGLLPADVVPQLGRVGAADAVWNVFCYPVLALLCGFTLIGFLLEPLLAAVRGFLLAFAATALCRLYGFAGLLLALASGAVELAVVIPCFLLIAARGLSISSAITGAVSGRYKGVRIFDSLFFVRMAGILLLLAAAVFAEIYLTPWLAGLASRLIS